MKKYCFSIGVVMFFIVINGFSQRSDIKNINLNERIKTLTPETQNLLKNLKIISQKRFMFGHQDDPLYGIGWEGDEGRSDVKSVVGDYPAVMGFDLGRIELGNEKNIDNVSFEKIRQEIIHQYNRGGMITISWHVNNPLTDGDSWDVTDSTVVASVMQGGENHEKMLGWIDHVADFLLSLKTKEGMLIPVVFRPWHEHTGSWFWWGKDLCSSEQYKTLWRMTSERLRLKGVNNVLLAYSPGMESDTVEEYLERYPGDDIIDVLGTDVYQYERSQYIKQLNKMLTILTEAGKKHDKPIALTETGFEGIPDSLWWTGTLLPVIEKYPLSYVLVWRNAREKSTHYYAPYPGQVSADDFVRFSQSPKMLFAGDDFELYK